MKHNAMMPNPSLPLGVTNAAVLCMRATRYTRSGTIFSAKIVVKGRGFNG